MFSGKSALVVGGTGGLGAGLSRALAASGARVTAVGRHRVEGVEILELNLDNPSDRAILVERARATDILCVVRGPFLQKPLADTTADEWDSIVQANLGFPGSLVSAALPEMVARRWGRILLFGGTRTDSIRGFRTNAAYAAAKTGLSSLAKSVALAHASDGVSCNVLCPGLTETEYLDGGQKAALAAKNPDGELIGAERVTEAAMFLLSGPECNGLSLSFDKGWAPTLI